MTPTLGRTRQGSEECLYTWTLCVHIVYTSPYCVISDQLGVHSSPLLVLSCDHLTNQVSVHLSEALLGVWITNLVSPYQVFALSCYEHTC